MPSGHTLAPGVSREAIAAVLDRLEHDVAQSALPAATLDRVVLVAGELASNAAEHGDVTVRLWWEARPSGGGGDLCVSPGPDVSAVLAAVLPENEAVRGRGLFLARVLGDGVETDGETLCVQFHPRTGE